MPLLTVGQTEMAEVPQNYHVDPNAVDNASKDPAENTQQRESALLSDGLLKA